LLYKQLNIAWVGDRDEDDKGTSSLNKGIISIPLVTRGGDAFV
jgi:hypothetical protein